MSDKKKNAPAGEGRAKGSMADKETVADYILMDSIGRGAFGVVYRAVHRHRGHWVAIKRVKLNKKKKLQLSSLMMEIDLLKSLKHPKIVHYVGHELNDEMLSIIMEYIENGSLESVLRRYGKFPESLVATYMAQVVEGLAYLHSEGIIHRDIKGANILITTLGGAKLADFGVSTRLEDISSAEDSFAGTPYWMAPEIITMSGATTACDIWSVACTIIELLTGTPPYGNLPPAASLYRIVQDDHPPIPEGITDALRDLLLLCFQKDVDRRVSAEKLMKHPWLIRARKQEDFEVAKDKIEDYKQATTVLTTGSVSSSSSSSGSTASLSGTFAGLSLGTFEPIDEIRALSPRSPRGDKSQKDAARSPRATGKEKSRTGTIKKTTKAPKEQSTKVTETPKKKKKKAPSVIVKKLDAPATPITKEAPVVAASPAAKNAEAKQTTATSSPTKPAESPKKDTKPKDKKDKDDHWLGSAATVRHKPHDDGILKFSDDEDSLPTEHEDDDELSLPSSTSASLDAYPEIEGGTSTVRVRKVEANKKGAVTALYFGDSKKDDAKQLAATGTKPAAAAQPVQKPIAPTATTQQPAKPAAQDLKSSGTESEWSDFDDSADELIIDDDDDEEGGAQDMAGLLLRRGTLTRFQDDEDEDEEDGFEMDDQDEDVELQLQGHTKESESEEESDADPFDNILEFQEEDKDAMLQLQRLEHIKTEVLEWMRCLNPTEGHSEEHITDAVDRLIATFKAHPALKTQLVNNTTLIHLLNMMEVYSQKNNWRMLQAVLMVINEIISTGENKKAQLQINFCLLGGIAAVTKFAASSYPKTVRIETARFLGGLAKANPAALQMFIACGGLSVLVTLLEPHYTVFKELVRSTVDLIWTIFNLQILPRNDFCHLFTKCGLLPRLAAALSNIYADATGLQHLWKIVDIFFYFSQASLDMAILEAMCQPVVLKSIREVLDVKPEQVKPAYHILWMLHVVSNLTAHTHARVYLESHGFIPVLIRFLSRREEFTAEELGTSSSDDELEERENVTLVKIHRLVLNALFNMCQLDPIRQERVALAGIIPALIFFIEEGKVHFLKELAVEIFLSMPHASQKVRNLLWTCNSFPVFVRLLDNPSWFVDILQCFLFWLREEPDIIQKELAKNVDRLINVFSLGSRPFFSKTFLKALDPLLSLVQESPELALLMLKQGVLPVLLTGLKDEHPYIRGQLLKILHSLLLHHPDPKTIPGEGRAEVFRVLTAITKTDSRMGIKHTCNKVLALLS